MTEIINTKDGHLTVVKDGVYLLSQYTPMKDLSRVLPDESSDKQYIVFGSGAGQVVSLLQDRGVSADDVMIFEPDGKVMAWLTDEKSVSAGWIGKQKGLTDFIENGLMKRKKTELVVIPAFMKAYPDEYKIFEKQYRNSVRKAAENIKVNAYFSKLWFINFMRNVGGFIKDENKYLLNWKKKWAPVLVVSSGPSLNRYIDEIKRHRGGMYVISVLSAARTLIHNGIRPDYIVVSDGGVANKLHYDGIPGDIPILANVYANSALCNTIPNPVVYYNLMNELPAPSYRLDLPSVTLDAGVIARRLFKGHIIFCGFDLAYSDKGSHSRKNALCELRMGQINRLLPLETMEMSFLKRYGLRKIAGGYTHSQFDLIKEQADNLFDNGCYYLRGGVDFENIPVIETLDGFIQYDEPVKRGGLKNIAVRPEDYIMEEIVALYSLAVEQFDEMSQSVFVREVLGGINLDLYKKYLSRKLEIFADGS